MTTGTQVAGQVAGLTVVATGAIPGVGPDCPVEAYLGRLGPSSRRTQRNALDQIARLASEGRLSAGDLAWHSLTEGETQAVRERLASQYVPPTANRMISALRGVLREAWRLGLMNAEAYHTASAVANVPWYQSPRGRVLRSGEIRRLFAACGADPSPAGVRDAALLTVLYSAGLRRSEAAALDLTDYDSTRRELTVRGSRHERERVLYAVGAAANTLERWVVTRGETPGPLFLPVDKGGKIVLRGERMREQSIYRAVLKRAEQADVEPFSCQGNSGELSSSDSWTGERTSPPFNGSPAIAALRRHRSTTVAPSRRASDWGACWRSRPTVLVKRDEPVRHGHWGTRGFFELGGPCIVTTA